MSISLKEFNELHAVAQSKLDERVLAVLERSENALSAEEVAADLLGITNRYLRILSPEIAEVQPAVVQILDLYAAKGKLRTLITSKGLAGNVTVYAASPGATQ